MLHVDPGFLPGIFFRVGSKIYCYANFFCYANFSIVFGLNLGGQKSPRGGQTASGGRKPFCIAKNRACPTEA